MDLGCLDLGCISVSDKLSADPCNKGNDATENVASGSKTGKSKSPRGSTLNAVNKSTTQIKKPPHRKNSPINWFPRKKVDSYLKRKIKMLQEIDGMNLTLDETLGDSNPHYSRVLREKIAAREAAEKAMEARKAALVEASWCKILRAARIQSKEAEELLLKAEKTAAEAFETATNLGVIMYDKPNHPSKLSEIETFSEVNGGRSTSHTVTASFETAFEVDKEVATAIRTAFIRFASCPSFNKDEFKELLSKISQHSDIDDNNNQEPSEFSSEYESESGSEAEIASQYDGFDAPDKVSKLSILDTKLRKSRRRQSLEKLNMTKLVDMMLERLRSLKEDELSSLATIVATCGLSAALAEEESSTISRRMSSAGSAVDYNFPRRMSTAGSGLMAHSNAEQMRRKQIESELPSLDKFLVKHMSKLEREVQEAKNRRKNTEGTAEHADKTEDESSHETIPDLGSILVKKHASKLEKEIEDAKKNPRRSYEYTQKKPVNESSEAAIPGLESVLIKHSSKLEKEVQQMRKSFEKAPNERRRKENVSEVPSLDKFLVKHVSRLEKEVQDAKNRRTENVNKIVNNSSAESQKDTVFTEEAGKENIDENLKARKQGNQRLQYIKHGGKTDPEYESLDKLLVKHVSRLEKEKLEFRLKEEEGVKDKKISGRNRHIQLTNEEGSSLDQILVKHSSKLEKEKLSFASHSSSSKQAGEEGSRQRMSRREARERELQEAWGGLGLGNSVKPHLSRLERDKAAWIKAEEEERRQAVEKV
ncbi:hypothetical protein M5689_000291 [Euphorbia peplus]|nr:hypothetical protein M5689_000291 [Euphorbia peplus]